VDEFWLLIQQNFPGRVALSEIQVWAEEYDVYLEETRESTNIALSAAASMSTRSDPSSLGPNLVKDGNLGSYASTNGSRGEWIRLSFSVSCMRVTKIVVRGHSFSTLSYPELRLMCGTSETYSFKGSSNEQPTYTLDTSSSFATAPRSSGFWLLFRKHVPGHVALLEIEVYSEEYAGQSTNIALTAEASMSSQYYSYSNGPTLTNDANGATYALTSNFAEEWIKLSFFTSCKTVTSIVVNGHSSFKMISSEVKLMCGKTQIFSFSDFFDGRFTYTIPTTSSFLPAPPVPAASEFWLLYRKNHVGRVLLREIEIIAEEFYGVSKNIALTAEATFSQVNVNGANFAPENVNDGNYATQALSFAVSGGREMFGAWIKLVLIGDCMTVTEIVVNGGAHSEMFDSEVRLMCGTSLLYSFNGFQTTLPSLYALDTADSFAPSPPVPAADELWLLVRAPVTYSYNWWIHELELFAHEWDSDTILNIAQGGNGLGWCIFLTCNWWVLLQAP
jgi:hypothetical protein